MADAVLHDAGTPTTEPGGDQVQTCERCGIELHRIAAEDVGAMAFQFFAEGDLTIYGGAATVHKVPGVHRNAVECTP